MPPSSPAPAAITGPQYGMFPATLTPIARTTHVNVAVNAVAQAKRTGLMAAIYGPSGSGKTAAAHFACQQVGGQWLYVQAPWRAGTKDVISAWYTAVIGQAPRSTARAASNELVHALWDKQVGLVIDEVHYSGVTGIQAIRYVHDQVAATYGYRIPIVLVGADLDVVLAASGGEMDRRAPWRAKFKALPDPEIAEILPTMHHRFAGMDPRLIKIVNTKYAHGLPGRWANFAVLAADQPGTGPLTNQDVSDILHTVGGMQ